ncbi:mismatch-specific DNA-glycosylase [Bradyrhizobium japonicum]|uniref:mismatch-specific DNA-glycosylase n=1 Tax=Bradyrhizobium japonicum TaxID=375 RepID=UPI002715291C|nr:mismatch-specific DNA-glycosylase [Bradyrhizobium japonicum]WLB56274.1 mismatch-specific DNA-glycosylase [Bradyrhizobium japonicum]WLB61829.1 mismatch-specific DNA-glycosylase [Bradyrhizobium japonicum]
MINHRTHQRRNFAERNDLQTDALLTQTTDRLPDQLRPNLRLVFVGTAASTRSAEVGHYYAHPGNRFWRAIQEAGITPRRYQPSEFAMLIELGIGFTDLSKSGAGMDHQIARETIDVAGFKAKIDKYRPRTIAFTSKKAASLFYRRPSSGIALGRQPRDDSLPEIFVLPSPSGAASGHWTLEPWRELAAWIAA